MSKLASAFFAATISLIAVSFLSLTSPAGLYAREQGTAGAIKDTKQSSDALIAYTVLSSTYKNKEDDIPFKIAVWYPTTKRGKHSYILGPSRIMSDLALDGPVREGKHPVLFYSHGATGAGTSSFFICETLAKNGYIVVAPDYLDTVCAARIDELVPFDGFMRLKCYQYISWLRGFSLNKDSRAGRIMYAYRPTQLSTSIRLMLNLNGDSKSPFHQHIDENKIGLFGHSFGAWTSLMLAGAGAPEQIDNRIKAVAALSGPCNEHVYSVVSDNDLKNVHVPLLFEFGEKEPETFARQDDKKLLFDKANAPKVLISIKGADHFSFSGGIKGEHKLASEYLDKDPIRKTISETTLDFFDAFLKDDQNKRKKLQERTEGLSFCTAEF